MLLNCGVGEDSWESLYCKEIQPVHPKRNQWNIHWKDWCWSWNSNTLATWYEEVTHLKRPWWWERLKAGGEADDRGWDGWMASPTQRTWVWVIFRSWWWTRRPGVLQVHGVAKSWTRLSDWSELNWRRLLPSLGSLIKFLNISMYSILCGDKFSFLLNNIKVHDSKTVLKVFNFVRNS